MTRALVAPAILLTALALVGCVQAPTTARQQVMTIVDAPLVAELAPLEGGLTGGETVTISGTDLETITRVTIGGEEAGSVTVVDSTTVTAVVPHSIDYVSGKVVEVEVLDASGVVAVASPLTYTYTAITAIDRQLEYAFAHWNNYNLASYGDFTTWGGDCINFVSQTLIARGWTTTAEWFNDAQQEWAPAFVHVPTFDEWLTSHPEIGATRLTLADSAQAKIGDVVMFDWDGEGSLDHAQVISGIEGDQIYMVGHDIDTIYRSIDTALQQQGTPAALVYFWSLPA